MSILIVSKEDDCDDPDPMAQKFIKALMKAADCDYSDILARLDSGQTSESLSNIELYLLYRLIMTYSYIAKNSFEITGGYVNSITVAPEVAAMIQDHIKNISEIAGKKALLYGIDPIEKIYEIDGDRINPAGSDMRDDNKSGIRFDCEYNSDYNCYAITGCSNYSSSVIFPSVVDGHKIEVIGEDIFLSSDEVEEIEISEGIRVIDYCAFRFCKNIDTVKLPDGLKELHKWAFEECYSLTSIGNL